jgi:hypothetical protein
MESDMSDFEDMCEAIEHYCRPLTHTRPVTLEQVEEAPLEEVLVEAARRFVSDPFFVTLGRRLFEDYTIVRW